MHILVPLCRVFFQFLHRSEKDQLFKCLRSSTCWQRVRKITRTGCVLYNPLEHLGPTTQHFVLFEIWIRYIDAFHASRVVPIELH